MGFSAGDAVQTPFGKGVVREVRNGGRLLVDVGGRAMLLREPDLTPLAPPKRSASRGTAPAAGGAARPPRREGGRVTEVDLHGLTVPEAIARAEQALNDALLNDASEVRFIHGRSGGRIRVALHRRLAAISTVRSYRVDSANEGVTIAYL